MPRVIQNNTSNDGRISRPNCRPRRRGTQRCLLLQEMDAGCAVSKRQTLMLWGTTVQHYFMTKRFANRSRSSKHVCPSPILRGQKPSLEFYVQVPLTSRSNMVHQSPKHEVQHFQQHHLSALHSQGKSGGRRPIINVVLAFHWSLTQVSLLTGTAP